jgi:ABC-type Fe3+ transport system permease subunit
MTEPANDPQDPLIRTILLSAAAAVLGLVSAVLVVTAMISANWNFMQWME